MVIFYNGKKYRLSGLALFVYRHFNGIVSGLAMVTAGTLFNWAFWYCVVYRLY